MVRFIDDTLQVKTFEDAYGCPKESSYIGENVTAGASMQLANAGKTFNVSKPAPAQKFDLGDVKKTADKSASNLKDIAKSFTPTHESIDSLCDPEHYLNR